MTRSLANRRNRDGAIVPMFAIILPIVMLFAAMAINIAYIQLAQTELDIATDASTRAASRIYSSTGKLDLAHQAAEDAAALNPVAGESLEILQSDLELGISRRASINDRYDFQNNATGANAVRITGNRTEGSPQGPIPTFLPSLLGRSGLSISSQAISARVEVDIALVFDRSGSMAYADDEPAVYPPIPAAAPAEWDFGDPTPPSSRWLDAVSAAEVFVDTVTASPQNENLALVTYADAPSIDVLLSTSYNTILNGLAVYTAELEGGGTNIAAGIKSGTEALSASNGGREFCAKVLVVMTDGHRTVGDDPVVAAKDAAGEGVSIFAVTFSDEADQDLMKKIAEEGQGQHFHAKTREDLIKVFETIGASLPTLIVK